MCQITRLINASGDSSGKRRSCPNTKKATQLAEHEMYVFARQLVPLQSALSFSYFSASRWARNEDIDLGGKGRFRPPYYPAKNMASKKKLAARKRVANRVICPPVFLLASFFSFSQPSC